MPEEVGQLQRLFEFLEEHLDAPAAAIQIGDGLGAPGQVVGEENHFPQLAVHLDQGHHAAQLDRIGCADRTGQANQIVTEDVAVPPMLELAHDPILEVVLGPGHPEDLAPHQVRQVGKVHVSLVKDHDLPSLYARAQFVRPQVVMFPRRVHQGKARQEGLQIQAHMTLCGGDAWPNPDSGRPVEWSSSPRRESSA